MLARAVPHNEGRHLELRLPALHGALATGPGLYRGDGLRTEVVATLTGSAELRRRSGDRARTRHRKLRKERRPRRGLAKVTTAAQIAMVENGLRM